ncbi:MAG TPA: hypothetical protein VI895_06460, partial [Bdellovibrionota bacterium]|nr:hypothetical protein [Bdellovibrionota bacterium]
MQKIDGRFRCLIAGILILGGCAKLSTPGTTAPNAAETLKQIKCVAVVPFDNRTSDKAAGDVMARLVSMAGMSSGRFRAMDSGSVTTYLGFQNVQIASVTDARFAANLGKLLDVDAVLMGSVEEYGYRNAGGRSVSEPAVAMSARLVAVGTAEVVW